MGATLASLGGAAPLQAQPTIRHEEVRCIPRDEFSQFLAGIESLESIRSAKLYFRSELYPEFYFVELVPDTESYRAVLPLPSEETTRVVYYIEAVDATFATARSREYVVDVSSSASCPRGPGAVAFLGEPGIVVGSAALGASALPAGFQAVGVVGFLTVAGPAAAAGGAGIGLGVAVGVVAGAASGVGVLVAGGNEEEAASSTVPLTSAPPLSRVSSTSSAPAGAPSTSSTPDVPAGTTTSASTGTPPEAPSTVPATTTTPTTPATSTVSPVPTACFDWQPSGTCKVRFDAACSTGTVTVYEWTLLGPPVPPPPAVESFTFDFSSDPRCGNASAFNRPVRLRVVDTEGRSDTVEQNVWVPQTLAATSSRTLALTTRLVSPTGESFGGFVSIDGAAALRATSGSASYPIRLRSGDALVVASLPSPVPPGTLWEFDFGRDFVLAGGGFRVESGTALAMEGARIVFRLTGDPDESIRFRVGLK